jgi:transposase
MNQTLATPWFDEDPRYYGARCLSPVFHVVRTGCQWKEVPKERFGCTSTIHRYFLEWAQAGFFRSLWQAGLLDYDELRGIAWDWQSIDGAMTKAPLAQESVGANPTDRGKKRDQTPPPRGRPRYPARHRAHRSEPA